MNTMDLMGHLGFILIALSFLVRDIVWLRILSAISQVVLIIYNYFGPPAPIWLVIGWSLLFFVINLVQLWLLFKERRGVLFSEREQELYATVFRALSPVECLKLLRLARWEKAEIGQDLTVAGQPLDQVLLIYNGEAAVRRGEALLTRLKDGAFIGEMEFLSKGAATATVTTSQPTSYLAWSYADLRSLLARNPSMFASLQAVFSADMVQKLNQATPGSPGLAH